MLRKFSILTISLVTLFLVGCSSSNNNSTDTSTDTSTNKSVTGTVYKFTSGDTSFASANLSSNTNIKQIIVDGETISVSAPSGVSSGEVTNINGSYYSGTNYTDSTFGLLMKGTNAYLYAQGNMTDSSSMPTTGTASYSGTAILASASGTTVNADTASITLDVNFASQTLTGTVVHSSGNLALAANISGSTFSGTSSDNTTVNGQFNGTGASEASGTLNNGSTYGSFGVVKQ